MPYIDPDDRAKWHDDEFDLISEQIENCGELNYIITRICHNYLKRKGLRYQNINDIIGALEGAKLELYRRVAGPYEDEKIQQNGDVFEINESEEDHY
jgi:hypothetical protein